MKSRQHWKYKNITLWLISILFALIIYNFGPFHSLILKSSELGLLGAFLAGILFVSTFTMGLGVILLSILATSTSPVALGLVAGYGAVIGDFIIFRFVKDNLREELELLYDKFGSNHLHHVLHSRYFR